MIRVYGTPAPQGSKQAYVRGKRAVLVEVSKKVKPWREAVVAAAQKSGLSYDGTVAIHVIFYMPRPKNHYGTRKGQPYVKDTSPRYPASKPDIDKLLRSTFDALTDSGIIEDDSRVVEVYARKLYEREDCPPGAAIQLTEW